MREGGEGEEEGGGERERPVSELYATVDKSMKTVRLEAAQRPHRRAPDEDSTSEHSFSGLYEEVRVTGSPAQSAAVDASGYMEVSMVPVGAARDQQVCSGYEVGYSGSGSLRKLRKVLGPDFSKMSGEERGGVGESAAPVTPLPEGRRVVRVVLLNGKAMEFTVGVDSVASELFDQVASHQSLKETHVFGLAVRQGEVHFEG